MLKVLILSFALLCAVEGIPKTDTADQCGMDSKIDDALQSASVLRELYEEYKSEHCIAHAEQQNDMRLELFRQQLTKIQKMRKSRRITWNVGITHLAHLTDCEKELFHGHNDTQHYIEEECSHYDPDHGLRAGLQGLTPSTREKLDDLWDWRAIGAVTPVKGKVNDRTSGWAHAALVPLETIIYKDTRQLRDLSAQELLDCTYHGVHHSIDKEAGNLIDAWGYIMRHHRVGYATDIPETGVQEPCDERITGAPNAFEGFHLAGEKEIAQGNLDDYPIQFAVRKSAPVVVTMHAAEAHLDVYRGGTYNWKVFRCNDDWVHAMAIVGYDERHFIVKNSWGQAWGDNGYLWWERHVKGHNCNLLRNAYLPVVNKREVKDPNEGDYF